MRYLRLLWKHNNPDYPTVIVSELDGENWERRKVEVWADGRKGYADNIVERGGTGLGLEPWQDEDLARMALGPEFEVRFITPDEFEEAWVGRCDACLPPGPRRESAGEGNA